MNPQNCAVVIIDAQKGFTDSMGSFGRYFGAHELSNIEVALMKLQTFLQAVHRKIRTLFVRSEYEPGQFTQKNLQHPLAYLCVPNMNHDCDWAEGMIPYQDSLVATKKTTNALSSNSYRTCIQYLIINGVEHFIFCGFTLTTCVQHTAIHTHHWMENNHIASYVAVDMSGSRSSTYQQQGVQPSLVEQVILHLKRHGIKIISSDFMLKTLF